MEFIVYMDSDNNYYSEGVKRAFGANKIIRLKEGGTEFSSVQPLMCNPKECNLTEVGFISVGLLSGSKKSDLTE